MHQIWCQNLNQSSASIWKNLETRRKVKIFNYCCFCIGDIIKYAYFHFYKQPFKSVLNSQQRANSTNGPESDQGNCKEASRIKTLRCQRRLHPWPGTHWSNDSLIVRYISKGDAIKRFLRFTQIFSHKAEHLSKVVLQNLKQYNKLIFMKTINHRPSTLEQLCNYMNRYMPTLNSCEMK